MGNICDEQSKLDNDMHVHNFHIFNYFYLFICMVNSTPVEMKKNYTLEAESDLKNKFKKSKKSVKFNIRSKKLA